MLLIKKSYKLLKNLVIYVNGTLGFNVGKSCQKHFLLGFYTVPNKQINIKNGSNSRMQELDATLT